MVCKINQQTERRVFFATFANYFAPFAVRNNNRKERRDLCRKRKGFWRPLKSLRVLYVWYN